MSEDLIRDLINKPKHRRTAEDVRRLRTEGAVYGGCCEAFANNSGCGCLMHAVNQEAFAVPDSQAPKREPTMNDTVTEFLKAELVRVQNERDAAQANERQQLQVVAELLPQLGVLMACVIHAAKAAENEEFLSCEAYDEAVEHVKAAEARIARIGLTRAVV